MEQGTDRVVFLKQGVELFKRDDVSEARFPRNYVYLSVLTKMF